MPSTTTPPLQTLIQSVLDEITEIRHDLHAHPEILFTEHHEAHAASAFYPSPYDEAAVLCLDGVGEWATTSAWAGHTGASPSRNCQDSK